MIKYTFTKPLEYGNKIMKAIELHEPKVRHMKLVCQIKEGYNAAQLDMLKRMKEGGFNESPDQKKDEKATPEEIEESVKAILDSACVGTDKIYENIKALYLSVEISKLICQEESEKIVLNEGYLNRMNTHDYINMSAKYIAAFISPVS